MIRPSLDLIVVVNSALREPDEFFDDEDELDRVERVLQALEKTSDPVLPAEFVYESIGAVTSVH